MGAEFFCSILCKMNSLVCNEKPRVISLVQETGSLKGKNWAAVSVFDNLIIRLVIFIYILFSWKLIVLFLRSKE